MLFALFFALGKAVGHNPDPAWLLTIEASWVNHSTLIAWWLTWFGYAYALLPICIVLIGVAIRYPQWRVRVAVSIVLLLLAWQGADFFQHVFARPRRLDWVVKHETAFGYPSSHASIATAFYFLWALFLRQSNVKHRNVWFAALTLFALGIIWSRLALGAHYLTDIVGGVLFGATLIALADALTPINVLGRLAGRA